MCECASALRHLVSIQLLPDLHELEEQESEVSDVIALFT